MAWEATLGGTHGPDEEREIATALKKVAAKFSAGLGFWTSNTPIDLGALETETTKPDSPPRKPADSKPATHKGSK